MCNNNWFLQNLYESCLFLHNKFVNCVTINYLNWAFYGDIILGLSELSKSFGKEFFYQLGGGVGIRDRGIFRG